MKAIKTSYGYKFTCTDAEAWEADDALTGLCTYCGNIEEGIAEPDASGYTCNECNQKTILGFAEAVIMGLVHIQGD